MDLIDIWRVASGVPPGLWVSLFALCLAFLLLRAVKAGLARVERAIVDVGRTLEQLLVRVIDEERTAHGLPARGQRPREESLPEGWAKSGPGVSEETVNRLRQWLLDHPDEARVWRLANPAGFRLWIELLGPDVVRHIWPEEFPSRPR